MALTDKVVKSLDYWLPKLFADSRLVQSGTYKKVLTRAYDSTEKHTVSTYEEATLSLVCVEEKTKNIKVGESYQPQRYKKFLAKVEDLPDTFLDKESLEDILIVASDTYTILSTQRLLDIAYILEVYR